MDHESLVASLRLVNCTRIDRLPRVLSSILHYVGWLTAFHNSCDETVVLVSAVMRVASISTFPVSILLVDQSHWQLPYVNGVVRVVVARAPLSGVHDVRRHHLAFFVGSSGGLALDGSEPSSSGLRVNSIDHAPSSSWRSDAKLLSAFLACTHLLDVRVQ